MAQRASEAGAAAGAEEAGREPRRQATDRDLRREVQAYYHAIAAYLDLELADREDGCLWEWAAATPPGCRVLEVGAGTGRATASLARAARRVIAFDLSIDLIELARRRLAGHPRVALLVADARELELAARFDLAVAAGDPFSHLLGDGDRDRALATVARHLQPGGRFILDAAWFPPDRRRAAASPCGLTLERVHRRGGEDLEVREDWRCEPGGRRLCTARFAYSRRGRPLAEAAFRARLWSVRELYRRFQAAGLEVVSLWGDYDRQPWRRGCYPRLIACARRPR